MEPPTKSAVLLGTKGEPEVELCFGYHDLHPVTSAPLRDWVKALPNRRWNPSAKSWRVSLTGMAKGTLRDAGFTVTFLDGSPAKPSDLSTVRDDRAGEDFVVPAWFGLALDPYQRDGAERVAAGRFLLADTPGLGKTRQLLAVAAGLGPARVLILCPPVVLTHWLRETEESGLVGQVAGTGSSEAPGAILAPPTTRWPSTSGDGLSMSDPPPGCAERLRAGEIAVIRPGRKESELPERGVVIVPDTLVAARRKLLASLWAWQPDLMIYDEAHRAKTWDSKRSVAARTIAGGTVGPVLVSTGTPMFAQPAEMVPLLDMTGQLGQVFGGRAAFVDRYLRLNRYRQLVARPERLPELRAKLDREVWVRRTKTDVLADLPPKSRRALVVDVDRSGFDAAHAEVAVAAARWLADYHAAVQALPSEEEILEWCQSNLAFVSSLRRAAGLCKVPAASEYICEWVQANTVADPETGTPRCERPLVVWTHHRDVTEAMATTVPAALVTAGLGQAAVIAGGTPTDQRSRIVDAFQAGEIPVLVGSITAAGVGITLTRSSDVLFTETDWTPGVVSQAEDRCHRKGQQNHVIVTTMVAPGTLDEPIQTVLAHKARVLDAVMPGDDHHVEVMNGGQRGSDHWATAASLLAGIVRELIASEAWKKRPHRAA